MANKLEAKRGLKTFATFTVSTAATGLSDIYEIQGLCPRTIQMSTGWTNANLTFRGAVDSTGSMGNVRHSTGNIEVTYVCTASQIHTLNPEFFAGLKFLQLRSGVSTAAVAQSTSRSIVVGFTAVDNLN